MGVLSISHWSLRTKVIVATTSLMALGMALLGVLTQLVLGHLVAQDVDRVLSDRAETVVAALSGTSGHGVQLPATAAGDGVAVLDASGSVVAGQLPPEGSRYAHAMKTSSVRRTLQIKERTRILTVPYATGPTHGHVVVWERLHPYEQAETYALYLSIALGILVTLAAGVIAAWVMHRALAQVGVMSAQAVEWGEHDLEQRFDLGDSRDEITRLGAALDILLERVAAALRAEQRLTSELAHELRTPLTTIQATADLLLLNEHVPDAIRSDLHEIATSSRRMAATITALLDLARSSTESHTKSGTLGEVLDHALTSSAAQSSSLTSDLEVDRSLRLAVPAELAVRAVAPVLENAYRHAAHKVTVRSTFSRTHVELTIANDGERIATPDLDKIFTVGVTSSRSGAGLGLSLARRVARSVGGDVLALDPQHGAAFVVRLPRSVEMRQPDAVTWRSDEIERT